MSVRDWALAAELYIPVSFALLGGLFNRRNPRQLAACLLSFLCTLPTLWALQIMNERAGWWSFGGALPPELYIGWAVLWGLAPRLCFPRLGLGLCAAIITVADLIGMPMCGPVLVLSPRWLTGEAAALVAVLTPALCIARWTLEDRRLYLRAAMQVTISAMLFLFLIPEIAFHLRPGAGWTPLFGMAGWEAQLALQAVMILGLPGLGAVMEFAERGRGMPLPYDPPRRLVTSGVYRYLANPMQISCGMTMLAWAGLLRNGWLVAGACISFVYSAGLAEWDEGQDLTKRFGAEWKAYRREVKNRIPRWKPYDGGPPARLYIARTCAPCSELRGWLEARRPLGLEFIDAETLPSGSILRLRYQSDDGGYSVEGVRALGRALEHLNLAWALAGTALRLPGVFHFVHILADASGFGPRVPGEAGV